MGKALAWIGYGLFIFPIQLVAGLAIDVLALTMLVALVAVGLVLLALALIIAWLVLWVKLVASAIKRKRSALSAGTAPAGQAGHK